MFILKNDSWDVLNWKNTVCKNLLNDKINIIGPFFSYIYGENSVLNTGFLKIF